MRKNATELVALPEFDLQTGRTEPVAYTLRAHRPQAIYVLAKFTGGPKNGRLFVKAGDAGPTVNPLGESVPAEGIVVEFDADGNPKGEAGLDGWVRIPLQHRLAEAVIGKTELAWRWEFSQDGKTWPIPNAAATQTKHKLYITWDTPRGAWSQNLEEEKWFPWTDALEWSCKWAHGQANEDDASAKLSAALFALGEGETPAWRYHGKAAYYAFPGMFCLTPFLDRLGSEKKIGKGQFLDCVACAGSLCVFGTAIGLPLISRRICSPSVDKQVGFWTGKICTLGSNGRPGKSLKFDWHQTVVKVAPQRELGNILPDPGFSVYDSCFVASNAAGKQLPIAGLSLEKYEQLLFQSPSQLEFNENIPIDYHVDATEPIDTAESGIESDTVRRWQMILEAVTGGTLAYFTPTSMGDVYSIDATLHIQGAEGIEVINVLIQRFINEPARAKEHFGYYRHSVLGDSGRHSFGYGKFNLAIDMRRGQGLLRWDDWVMLECHCAASSTREAKQLYLAIAAKLLPPLWRTILSTIWLRGEHPVQRPD